MTNREIAKEIAKMLAVSVVVVLFSVGFVTLLPSWLQSSLAIAGIVFGVPGYLWWANKHGLRGAK